MSNFSPAYIRSVYIERCKESAFSPYLKNATEARVKKACLLAYKKKNSFSDKTILRNFLEVPEDGDLDLALKKAEVGKFRPIVNFFKNGTKDPRDQTIDLVAWLIDFKFENSDKISEEGIKDLLNQPDKTKKDKQEKEENKDENRIDEVEENDDNIETDKTKKIPSSKKSHERRKKATIIALIVLVIAITSGLASLLFSNKKSTTPFLNFTGQEKYMYWLGDHYQPTNNARIKGVNIVPFNAKLVSDFRKITDQDTLTTRSVGKVWYVKINNKPEFYTTSGFHPGGTRRILKPLSKYMVDKYVIANKNLITLMQIIFSISLLVCICCVYNLCRKKRNKFNLPTHLPINILQRLINI